MNIKLIVCIIAILAVAAIMIYNRRKSFPPRYQPLPTLP